MNLKKETSKSFNKRFYRVNSIGLIFCLLLTGFFGMGANNVSAQTPPARIGIKAVDSSYGSISGMVTDASTGLPLAGVMVWARDTYSNLSSAQTDSYGNYTINNLTPGDYRVQVEYSGYALEYYNNANSYDNAALVTVQASQTTTNINFALDPGGNISGTITDAVSGLAIAGVAVSAKSTLGGEKVVQTDSLGNYTINYLAAGSYTVQVKFDGAHTQYAIEYYNSTYDQDDATPVTVQVGQTASGINFALESAGSVSGTIMDSTNNLPIEGVMVTAENVLGGKNSVQTNSDGNYTINNLLPGTCTIKAEKNSYTAEYYDNAADITSAAPVTIQAGLTTSGINFSLGLGASTPTGSISGKVTNSVTGLPLAGVAVWARTTQNGGNSTLTDSSGSYTINNLTTGTYKVEVNQTGYTIEYYNNAHSWEAANLVTVQANQTASGIDFALEPVVVSTGGISGKVTDSAGQSLAGVTVWVRTTQNSGVSAQTDSSGSYVINNLTAGAYKVEVNQTGYTIEYYNDTHTWDTANSVTVQAAQTTTAIDFSLEPAANTTGSISGKVTDSSGQALAEITVWAQTTQGSGISTQTDSSGNYVINNLTAGAYKVEVNQTGYTIEYYNDTHTWNSASSVTVQAAQTTTGIDFSLEAASGATGSISGKVIASSNGQTLAGVTVWARTTQSGGVSTQTDSYGRYVINNLSPGTYKVEASQTGYVLEYFNNARTWETANTVTVLASQTTSAIDFILEAVAGSTGNISGIVTDSSTGQPLAGVAVWAGQTLDSGTTVQTGDDGTFMFYNLAPGFYKVKINKTGYLTKYYSNANSWDEALGVLVYPNQTTYDIGFSATLISSIPAVFPAISPMRMDSHLQV